MITSIVILLFVGFLAGLSNGLVGIGGGVFVVPILTILGVNHSIAVAAAANLMISGAYSSFRTYYSKSLVDFKLAGFLISGGVFGVFLGSSLVNYWQNNDILDEGISVLLLTLLILISTSSVLSLARRKSYVGQEVNEVTGVLKDSLLRTRLLKQHFKSFNRQVSILGVAAIGVLAGFLTPALGVGGSIVMLPVLLNIMKISPSYVTGTINLHVLFSAILSTIFHYGVIDNSNFSLASILIIGTVIGSQFGSRLGAGVKANTKLVMANSMLLIITVMYIFFGQANDVYGLGIVDEGEFGFMSFLQQDLASYTLFCVLFAILFGHLSFYAGNWLIIKTRRRG